MIFERSTLQALPRSVSFVHWVAGLSPHQGVVYYPDGIVYKQCPLSVSSPSLLCVQTVIYWSFPFKVTHFFRSSFLPFYVPVNPSL